MSRWKSESNCSGVENAYALSFLFVPVIAFPRLVVVAQHAFATDDVGKAVLETVPAAIRRFGESPQHEFRKCGLRINDTR